MGEGFQCDRGRADVRMTEGFPTHPSTMGQERAASSSCHGNGNKPGNAAKTTEAGTGRPALQSFMSIGIYQYNMRHCSGVVSSVSCITAGLHLVFQLIHE